MPLHAISWPDVDAGPTDLVTLTLPLPVPAGTPVLRNGWQSWSAPTEGRLGDGGGRWLHADGLGPRHPWWTTPRPGEPSYDVLVCAATADRPGFVAGVAGGGALLLARPGSGGRAGELVVVREGPGPHPDVLVGVGDPDALLAELLDRVPGRTKQPALRGWSSWSGHLTDVTHDDVAAVCAAAQRFPGLQVVSVDDGWQAVVGDWDRPAPGFPGGVARTLGTVRSAGLVPGLWLAPFVAVEGSRAVAEHPERLLRDASGAPVVAMRTPLWPGPAYALDVTRPDVLAHVQDVVAGLVAAGAGYLKLDFVYAAALPGASAHRAPHDVRMRSALAAVREAAGEDTVLVGCGSPLWPAAGLVDAMRVGPDVGDTLGPAAGHADPDVAACLAVAARSSRLRAPLHDRLWRNDPDAVQLAPVPDAAYGAARRAVGRRAAAAGEMLFWSDRLADLDRAAYAEWERLAAVHEARTSPSRGNG